MIRRFWLSLSSDRLDPGSKRTNMGGFTSVSWLGSSKCCLSLRPSAPLPYGHLLDLLLDLLVFTQF